jgi:hypothetical protein
VISLFDVLSEIYNKISKYLGPPPTGQQMYGPLGLLSPHPGVSYLFTGAEPYVHTPLETESSLWGIANANNTVGSMGSPPPNWTSSYGEMVLKVDGKFKVSVRWFSSFCLIDTSPRKYLVSSSRNWTTTLEAV